MGNDLKERIESFRTIVLCSLTPKDDPFSTPFDYLAGDFAFCGLPHYRNLNELIEGIDEHSEVAVGIGYKAFCEDLRESILTLISRGGKTSYIIPFAHPEKTHNFLMAISSQGQNLCFFFSFFDNNTAFDFDSFAKGSFKDRLTGLFNFATMKNHLSTNRRNGYLCLFDLNKFKHINDAYGHGTGDDVLVLLAKYLIAICSMEEIYYRRGGDEFLFLALDNGLSHVLKLIGMIEGYLESLPKNELKEHVGLECSASFGLLELKYDEEGHGIDSELQLKLVDLAMYQAKSTKQRYHVISDEDAKRIIDKGDLDERLAKLYSANNR